MYRLGACWAMAKSWLDVQMDMELAKLQPGRMELLKKYGDDGSPGQGSSSVALGRPENWPLQVQNQQPRHLSSLFQKLHSSDMVHEAVVCECKEQHRQIEMNLMSGDISHLLELVWSWFSPSDDDQNDFRPHGEPHMLRFGAHLVLVLRLLLGDEDELQDIAKEKIMNVGDLILHMWRVPTMPIGAHELLSFLAEPLKQPTENLIGLEGHDVPDLIKESEDWSEYYSCDATYRNWLKIQLENAEVSPSELSSEEKNRAIVAAKETLGSSLLLLRKEKPWSVPTQDHVYDTTEPLYLELHATTILCLPSGECISPDATLCATLMSALHSSVSEEVATNRELMLNTCNLV